MSKNWKGKSKEIKRMPEDCKKKRGFGRSLFIPYQMVMKF